jgi:uncharacterized membrane protein YuzA (DUF378 family)
MISFLVTILMFLVILYVVRLVIGELGFPDNITKILYLIIGVIALFWLLDFFRIFSFPIH